METKSVGFLETMDRLMQGLDTLEHKEQKLSREIKELQAATAAVARDINTINTQLRHVRRIRHRFLDTARHILGPEGSASYKESSELTHGPDAVFDATLYLHNERTDIDTYNAVYGMSPWVVRELASEGYDYALHLINTYAGKRIKGETIPDGVEKKFIDLLAALYGDRYWKARKWNLL